MPKASESGPVARYPVAMKNVSARPIQRRWRALSSVPRRAGLLVASGWARRQLRSVMY
jgi:hypothetical protein